MSGSTDDPVDDLLLAEACLDRGTTRLLESPPVQLDSALGPVLAQAVHSSRASVMVTDAALDEPGPAILYVNPAFEAMTGHRAADVLGRSPRLLQGPATSRAVLDRLKHDLRTIGSFEGEAVNYRADGRPFVMSWRIAAVRGADGGATHYVAIQDDVTDERIRVLRARRIVADLQANLLPRLPAAIGGTELAAAYQPATPGFPVGGDWYDAVAQPDGAIALVVGDVAGSGVDAAAAMGRLRWSTHALLSAGTDVARVARVASRLAASDELYATMAIARLTPDGALEVVTSGHPPVLVLDAAGRPRPLRTANPMLGLLPDTEPVTTTGEVAAGELVVLYSDGVVDGGRIPVDEVPEVLADRVAGLADRSLDVVCRALTEGSSSRDDAAVLVARRTT